jgi:hypothetical protein
MRIYIAGPMTGLKDFNFPAFNAEADRLRAEGHEVLNPADHGLIDGFVWLDYMRLDIAQLITCDAIQLLPGWENSKGATLEHHIAQALGLEIRLPAGAPKP